MCARLVSDCFNHPGIEAQYRCKMCGKAVCNMCVVSGVTGKFCSEPCMEQHQSFIKRAQQLEDRPTPRKPWGARIRGFLAFLITVLAVVGVLGVIGYMFFVPVLTPLVRLVLETLGF